MLCEEERNRLVIEHLSLVWNLARRLHHRLPEFVDIDDLVGAGTEGLIDAANRFNEKEGASFRTYAKIRIHGEMIEMLRRNDPVRSRTNRYKGHQLKQWMMWFRMKQGREPTAQELAERLEVTLSTLMRIKSVAQPMSVVHLDELCNPGKGNRIPLQEVIPDTRVVSVDELLIALELVETIRNIVHQLPKREREVIHRYFFCEETLTVIAADYGCSVANISQIKKRAIARLHHALRKIL